MAICSGFNIRLTQPLDDEKMESINLRFKERVLYLRNLYCKIVAVEAARLD